MRGRLEQRTWQHDPDLYAPARYRRACNYESFFPWPLEGIPPLDAEVAGTISAAEDAIRRLNADARPALQPFARLLLRTESIASSKVEGLQIDARSLARAEARADLGETIGAEAAEILANVDAMQLAIEEATTAPALTVDDVAAIHRVLMARASNADRVAGRIRTSQNWIGGNDYNPCGADFVPPPPEEVDRLLEDLVRFCADDGLSPLVQAAVAHAQFETIHPFEDGNGRTGRALVQVILRRRGLAPAYVPPISIALAVDKPGYVAGLTAFREGRENEWLERFAVAAVRAADLASRYVGRVIELQRVWRELAATRVSRRDAGAWRLIDELPGYPVISVAVAMARIERSRPQASAAIEQLVAAGVLEPIGTGRRNRLFEAVGLLDLLSGLEAGGP